MIIEEDVINTIEIKKSKFITFLIYIDNVSNVKDKLDYIKHTYKGATHYCYAYKIGVFEKCSDDGEPSGTAGLPILNILKYEKLENILCVVVRFYGGVKLGAGGLIRAYAKCCKDSTSIAKKIPFVEYKYFTVILNYDEIKLFEYQFKDYIVNKTFNNYIVYDLKLPSNSNLIDSVNKYKQKNED